MCCCATMDRTLCADFVREGSMNVIGAALFESAVGVMLPLTPSSPAVIDRLIDALKKHPTAGCSFMDLATNFVVTTVDDVDIIVRPQFMMLSFMQTVQFKTTQSTTRWHCVPLF
jgi:hypothetical protein